MKNKILIGAMCTLLSFGIVGCSSTANTESSIPSEVTQYCTDWETYNETFNSDDAYSYSPTAGLNIKTVDVNNNISEVEFVLGSNTFRSIIPTELLESEMSVAEYHDYDKNGIYDFLIADNTAQYLYWFGIVPNSENQFTEESLKQLTTASADDFAVPAGYETAENYEKFTVDNDDYFAVVMECDNRGVSESDAINADSMHGYYVQLYDKTSLDYMAQFIGGVDVSEDMLDVLRNSAHLLRLKH